MIWGWGRRKLRKKFFEGALRGEIKFQKSFPRKKINFKRPSPGINFKRPSLGKINFKRHCRGKNKFIFDFSSTPPPKIINGRPLSGSVLLKQLTEPQPWQLLTCSRTVDSAGIPVQWMENHLSHLHLYGGPRWSPTLWMENRLAWLHLNTRVFLEFNQPTQLNIDRKLTEMI